MAWGPFSAEACELQAKIVTVSSVHAVKILKEALLIAWRRGPNYETYEEFAERWEQDETLPTAIMSGGPKDGEERVVRGTEMHFLDIEPSPPISWAALTEGVPSINVRTGVYIMSKGNPKVYEWRGWKE